MAREIADGQAEAYHGCVTDPPYHLISIVRRFGGGRAKPSKSTRAYGRLSKGFAGQQWDGADGEGKLIAFEPDTWRRVYDVLRPGAHLAAFCGTKNYHRLACAIEDAGFEVRDMLAWLYGSGFPKSFDIGKGLHRRKDWAALERLQEAIKAARKYRGLSQTQAARRAGIIGPKETLGGGGFMWFETGRRLPTAAQWPALKAALGLADDLDLAFEAAEREVLSSEPGKASGKILGGVGRETYERTAAATDLAKEWDGWGTALKPAMEPIVLARKPISEASIPANVLAHGTGGINTGVDAQAGGEGWPANVLHDGSAEVAETLPPGVARYFYSAKADQVDRCGSDHPTIKPVDLMAWLVRLLIPPGGAVLDPFAGSGTTGEAALMVGARPTLIERDAKWIADIERRMVRAESRGADLFAEQGR